MKVRKQTEPASRALPLAGACFGLLLAAASVQARVTRIVVDARTPVAAVGGQSVELREADPRPRVRRARSERSAQQR